MQREEINIPPIVLEWSEWIPWDDLRIDARSEGGLGVPNQTPGVYEARFAASEERLTIGKTTNLRQRIERGLVKGKMPHSAGKKIRASEDVSAIVVRWAVTDRPAAVEEELHRRHRAKFGRLPTYTKRT
jgi:hypothetical protein